MQTPRQREDRERRWERQRQLRRAAMKLPPALTARGGRAEVALRAKNAIMALGFVIETLADESAAAAAVEAAMEAANGAYRAACLRGQSIGRHAAMELVAAIRGVANDVLEGEIALEDVTGIPFLFGSYPSKDADAFRQAVEAWVSSERTLAQRGGRKRRPGDRWGPTFECVKRFGVANGISNKENLRREWQGTRRGRAPRSPGDSRDHGVNR